MPSDLTVAGENSTYLAFVHSQDCLIISPRGRIIAANEEAGREEAVIHRTDLAHALERRQQPESLLSERRPELYGSVTKIHCNRTGQSSERGCV
ncbi:MAG: hypothetical protein ACUVWR_06010 [Anaerolineae bacterium]